VEAKLKILNFITYQTNFESKNRLNSLKALKTDMTLAAEMQELDKISFLMTIPT